MRGKMKREQDYTPFGESSVFSDYDHARASDEAVKRIQRFPSIFEYLNHVFDAQTKLDAKTLEALDICGLSLEPFDPVRNEVDPHSPEQTAFMMGALAGLDMLDDIAQDNVIDLKDYRRAWTDASNFLPIISLEESGLTTEQKNTLVRNALQQTMSKRYGQLEKPYQRVLSLLKQITDSNEMTVDQIPSLCYGFAFVLIGGRIGMNNILNPPDDLDPNSDVDWDREFIESFGGDPPPVV